MRSTPSTLKRVPQRQELEDLHPIWVSSVGESSILCETHAVMMGRDFYQSSFTQSRPTRCRYAIV